MSWNEQTKAFTAGEALANRRRVKVESGTATTPPEVVYADAGEEYIGVTDGAFADGDICDIRLRSAIGSFEFTAAGAVVLGAAIYGAADGKVDDAVSGAIQGICVEAASAANDIIECVPYAVTSTAAGSVSVADTNSNMTGTDVETVLNEHAVHQQTSQAFFNLDMGGWTEQDGTALADFADGDSTTPGWNTGDESFGIRWNNHANPDPIATSHPYPPDLDPAANVVIHVLAAKVGATIGDAVTWTIEAFENIAAAAYDADADFGGTSSAMTGDATSKTCQEETLTLALANVTGSPGALHLTLQPTDGTLGTDDVIVLGVWGEYTRKLMTS